MSTLVALASTPLVILAVVALGYLLMCLAWPYANCRWCGGTGKLRPFFGLLGLRSFRTCHHCNHTGMRLRAGRRLYNHLRRLGADSSARRPR